MLELLKELDENLALEGYEVNDDELHIRVESARTHVSCSYCGQETNKPHSRTIRTIKDLPILGKKVKLLLKQKKYFCNNSDCAYKTFVERFDFFEPKATKTKRLQQEILRVSLTQSSLAASKYLQKSVVQVGKSTICNLLKKGL